MLTWNIHGARDASLSQIASEIRAVDADVVCLNEVRRAHIARLARALGMRAYGAVCRFGPYGNVVLTSQPVASFRRLRFARARRVDRRDASLVTLASGLTVACVHLNLRADERVAHAREFLAALPARAIVAGDFNETSERAAAQQMSERFDDAGGDPTFPSSEPHARIDYVWVPRGARVLRCEVLPTRASDHRALVVEVELRTTLV